MSVVSLKLDESVVNVCLAHQRCPHIGKSRLPNVTGVGYMALGSQYTSQSKTSWISSSGYLACSDAPMRPRLV